jgi:hypothetical protein
MRILIAIAIVFFAFASSAPGQRGSTEKGLKETLINLEKQSWEAWKRRDGKFFQDFLSDDHV